MASFADLLNYADRAIARLSAGRLVDHYRVTFRGPAGEAVLRDLAEVCCVTTGALAQREDDTVDEAATIANAAKQQVFIHIQNMTKLDAATLDEIFSRED